jgi:2-methylaconitate cis-trans-isomerase PrpF
VPDHDVDYLYGQVSIDKAFVDWSATAATCPPRPAPSPSTPGWSIRRASRTTACVVRIWQANIGKTIIAHVPVTNGQVQETGDFELDGVTFPAAEIVLEFLDPSDEGEEGGSMFPTGNLVDDLDVPGVGTFEGDDDQRRHPDRVRQRRRDRLHRHRAARRQINGDPAALARFEAIRAHGALRMGLIKTRKKPPPASTPRRSPSSRRRWLHLLQRQAHRAAPRSTCWCAPCRWASCTTP